MKRILCETKDCQWVADKFIEYHDYSKRNTSGYLTYHNGYFCRQCVLSMDMNFGFRVLSKTPITLDMIRRIERRVQKRKGLVVLS